ncbi:MAG: flagellar biogenesis protein [Tissierellia bacterium]|mgnify:CR=1 FL=1|nr:flagellar biogenesis protein [Tissierellia bacterium]
MEDRKDSIKKAVALSYKERDEAPRIIGKGQGELADRLLQVGKQEEIAIYEDKKLVEDLYRLDIDAEITPELYEAVARIIAFVYLLDREKDGDYEKE